MRKQDKHSVLARNLLVFKQNTIACIKSSNESNGDTIHILNKIPDGEYNSAADINQETGQ